MKVETLGQLRQAIKHLPDDFKLDVNIYTMLSDEQLLNSSYLFPWSREEAILEFNDVGYSDKVICFGVYRKRGGKE